MHWKCRSNFSFHASLQMLYANIAEMSGCCILWFATLVPVERLEYNKQKHSGCKLISHSTYRVKENWVAGILFKIFPKA